MVRIYQFQMCPYCYKVRAALDKMGLKEGSDYELVEASRGTPGRKIVIQLGGKSQVPFLVDGDTKMYESNDIIAYMKKKFAS